MSNSSNREGYSESSTFVRKVHIKEDNHITVKNIQTYMERTVTKFGSGAKVDRPKEFLGKRALLIIKKEED
ncbi:MAG: DUF2080 family transposase-associated protein [Candidatus Micrarchaeia archaeon]